MNNVTQFAHRNGVKLAYKVYPNKGKEGHSLPLVMISGWMSIKEDWFELPKILSQDRAVLTLDNRGIGESDIPGSFVLSDMADDVLFLMDELKWQKAHIMGISMGGMISQYLALKAPERVASLILGCTSLSVRGKNYTPPAPEVMEYMLPQEQMSKREITRQSLGVNLTKKWRETHPEEFERVIDQCSSGTRKVKGILLQYQALSKHDLSEKGHLIQHKTLIVHGDEDELLPYGNAQYMVGKLPNAKLYTMHGVGHMFWVMRPADTPIIVKSFLSLGQVPSVFVTSNL